jgi:NADH-quinone oxidoreductase subunit G
VSRTGQGDKILISADRNPNTRGALVTGLIDKLPQATLTELAQAIDSGQVKTVLTVNEDLVEGGLTAAQLAKVAVVYLGTHAGATSDSAKVILPVHTVFEKSGTFINQQFRLQKFNAAIPGLAGTANDLVVLNKLLIGVGGTSVGADLSSVWKKIAEEISLLGQVNGATLPETGVVLNSADFANLEFPEGETLHFKPAAKSVAAATA